MKAKVTGEERSLIEKMPPYQTRTLAHILIKIQLQRNQGHQHKTFDPQYHTTEFREYGNMLEVIGSGKNFLNRTPVVQILRPIVNKWDLMKLNASEKKRTLHKKLISRKGKNIVQLHI